MHVIELNDRNIRISDSDATLVGSPGFANIANKTPIFGEGALQHSRLHPHQSFNQFWSQLSLDPLVNDNNHFRHQADLAYAHLNELANSHKVEGDVIFAVPSHYNRDQLAILLGLANQCNFNAVGLVDLAVLNAVSTDSQKPALFLDIQLHQTVVTVLENKGAELSRGKVIQIPGTGLLALNDAWANMITDEFIAQSRFDPQHNADTEQYVYNQLPQWLAATIKGSEAMLEINNQGSVYQATVNLGNFEQRTRAIFDRISDEIQTIITPETRLYLPANMASLPGLTLSLNNVIPLDESTLSNNSFTNLDHIVKKSGPIGLVTSLPKANNTSSIETTEPQPSHILMNHTAYAINAPVIAELVNISSQADGLLLHHNPQQTVFINDKTLSQDTLLKLGDSLKLENPFITLQLIQVE